MDKNNIYLIVSAIIAGLSGYFFWISKGGVHFENMSLLIICIASIIAMVVFMSKIQGKSFSPLASALGLKVISSVSLGGGGHVDMEGEIEGRTVFLRYIEDHGVGQTGGLFRAASRGIERSRYELRLQLNNPHRIDLYVGPEGLLKTPANILSLPKKLDTYEWEWAEFVTVYGAPAEAIDSIFSNKANTEIFSAFFSKFDLRVKEDKMEFKVKEEGLNNPAEELKEILDYAISVANAIDNG